MSLTRRTILAGGVATLATHSRADSKPPLRVAIGVGPVASAFWATRDRTGTLHGLTVDLGTALAERLGRTPIFVPYANSGDITAAAGTNAWDVTFVPMDAVRAKMLDFGPAYDRTEATWIVAPGSAAQAAANLDAPEASLAAVKGTATGRAAQQSLTRAKITGYATVGEIIDGLKAGRIDAAAFPRDTLQSIAPSVPGGRILPGSFGPTVTAIAVPKGLALLADASAFMDEMTRDGGLARFRAQNKLP